MVKKINNSVSGEAAATATTMTEMRNALKAQILERLMKSIKSRSELIIAINLTTGVYLANVVGSKARNQLEVVGLSTPDCDAKEVAMVKDVYVEMLSNGEIDDMIRSVAPKQVYILPYEGFNHTQYLYDIFFTDEPINLDEYFENVA